MFKLILKIAIVLMVVLTGFSLFLCKVAHDKKYNIETEPVPDNAFIIKVPGFECNDDGCLLLKKE